MNKFRTILHGVALSAMILAGGSAMAEGKGDRADKAIAAAQGKLDVAAKLPGVGEVPNLQIDATTALRQSREARKSGHKDEAIALALKASQLSERAVVESQRQQANAVDAQNAAAANAQDQAASANARAASAERAADAAAADAAAARAAPPVVVAVPQPTTTVETTQSTRVVPATKRKVIVQKAKPARAVTTERTTTTVTN